MNRHPSPEVAQSIVLLLDALCSWERGTGRRSMAIVRDQGGYELRAVDGKPFHGEAISDGELFGYVTGEDMPPCGERETPETIAAWANETFGPASITTQLVRAGKEWKELFALANSTALSLMDDMTAREAHVVKRDLAIEVADVIICLSRTLVQLGHPRAVEAKMQINRARTWTVSPDGTGQHVKEDASGDRQANQGQ